jgi:hypothetical protein
MRKISEFNAKAFDFYQELMELIDCHPNVDPDDFPSIFAAAMYQVFEGLDVSPVRIANDIQALLEIYTVRHEMD